MKLITCSVENFASYKHLEFDYQDLGLSLVYGPTGSGKSTLQDVACWCLFGETPKGGAVDDVRSWNAEEKTVGVLRLEVRGADIQVTRIRGSASQNDLYWLELGTDHKHRGKDLVETQKLLNERLGVDFDLYCTAAYFNEFSPTSTFFLAKSKERRATLERIAPLELPKRLAEGASNARKETKIKLTKAREDYSRRAGRLEQLLQTLPEVSKRSSLWQEVQSSQIERIRGRAKTFEEDKNQKVAQFEAKMHSIEAHPEDYLDTKISKLRQSARCDSCGALKKDIQAGIEALQSEKNKNSAALDRIDRISADIEQVLHSENTWLITLETEMKRTNPFIEQEAAMKEDVYKLEVLNKVSLEELAALEQRFNSLNQLYDLSFDLRGVIIKNSVTMIESRTNDYLEKFFESELRVSFALKGSDELDVSITKNGNSCSFRQLSKGQRSLLRLCFVSSVMKAAANKAGVHFSQLFFDEALDGLDAELKVKSYRLFEELATEHESVILIDHEVSLQNLFTKRFSVKLVDDESQIEEEI